MDFQIQRLEAFDHLRDIRRIGEGEVGDLHDAHLYRGNRAELPHPGDDPQHAVGIAGEFTVLVGEEAADEFEMSRHDAELDKGFQKDFRGHARSKIGEVRRGKFEIQGFTGASSSWQRLDEEILVMNHALRVMPLNRDDAFS